MQALPQAMAAMGHYSQFIAYKLEPRGDKIAKIPVDYRTGRVMPKGVDWQNDPQYWTDAQTAIEAAARYGTGYGVGFLFTPADPFVFIDIDKAWDGTAWSPIATEFCTTFAGAMVEVSQSGTGLHIIGAATAVPTHGCKNIPLGLELYHEGRFVALTGSGATGNAGADITAPLQSAVAQYFPPAPGADSVRPAEWSTEPLPGYGGPADDDELIAKMLASGGGAGQVFGNRASFADLWNADPDALGRAYPDNFGGGRAYDASSADAALAAHLAFWTGGNCDRVERLMRRSALVRDKWDQHGSYVARTVLGAVSRCDQIYTGAVERRVDVPQEPSTAEPGVAMVAEPEVLSGFQYLAATQQIEHFKGCVYVQDAHRVFTPRGVLLKPEQFKATFGGYVFVLDAANDKTTKNAWEAFTESQAVRYPIAEGLTFRPEVAPGAIYEDEGRIVVNTYVPAKVRRLKGDPSRFLDHLRRILPNERDREIVLAYMAACVQHIGIKFQWWPLLQGAPGNGKSLLTWCVAYAVGMQYSHFPKVEEIGSKHNSWLIRRLFIGVEDVYVPGHRTDIVEALKPVITNSWLPIEPKGIDQFTGHVCANGMLNSNHKDGIRKTRDDRRFAVFFTAQQSAEDIVRDGMGGDYFPDIYDWLKGEGRYSHLGTSYGYAIVAEFLATYPIPEEFNPAGRCHRAPKTSTTDQAIAHGVGGVEQEILEAISEGRAGFCGGWISSMALDKLLERRRLGRIVPPNKRREMLQALGYDWHPALHDGRVNNPTAIDGGKPRLFIQRGHPDAALPSPATVSKAYQDAQAGGGVAAAVFGVDDTVNNG